VTSFRLSFIGAQQTRLRTRIFARTEQDRLKPCGQFNLAPQAQVNSGQVSCPSWEMLVRRHQFPCRPAQSAMWAPASWATSRPSASSSAAPRRTPSAETAWGRVVRDRQRSIPVGRSSYSLMEDEGVRKVDIAHSGQTVSEAMEQLKGEIKNAHRGGDQVLLLVHGFGASGVGGAIKAALATELPGLARSYGFKTYGHADKDRIPRQQNVDPRILNPGSTLLIFRGVALDRKSKQDFRTNFRNLRSRVKAPAGATAPGQVTERCRHIRRQLVSRGPDGSHYKCLLCGKTFLASSQV
jgi:hypothetical protein